ncbi:MAG: hypothetical protein JSU05_12550 [Bacteroidetes bacterium]|nr:hypothetical protein [Bacteroidota bacterium]
MTFNLAGGETLLEEENERLLILLVVVGLFIFTLIIARDFRKTGKKYTAAGIIIPPFFILLFTSGFYIYEFNFHTSFNKTEWDQSKVKPFKMAATLIKEKKLIGLTIQEIEDKLGQTSKENINSQTGDGSLSYRVNPDWTFSIYFTNGKVTGSELRRPILDL